MCRFPVGRAEPISFRNDYIGLLQEVYRYDDGRQENPRQRPRAIGTQVLRFARMWFPNKEHGFLDQEAMRERLSWAVSCAKIQPLTQISSKTVRFYVIFQKITI